MQKTGVLVLFAMKLTPLYSYYYYGTGLNAGR
jgi:hypothetical protein